MREKHGLAERLDALVVVRATGNRSRHRNRAPSRKSRLPCMTAHGTPVRVSRAQRVDDRRQTRVVVVVADPRFEQIAEDVELAEQSRASASMKLDEPANRLRVSRIEDAGRR